MIYQTDVFLLTAMNAAIADVRKNLFLVDDMLSDFKTDPYLKKLYGDSQVERCKEFISKTQINVVFETKMRFPDQAKFPAIVIGLGGGEEDTGRTGSSLGDSQGWDHVNPEFLGGVFTSPQIVLGPLTPLNYDGDTGVITFDTGVNLTNVFPGQNVFDNVNDRYYRILSVDSAQTLTIETGLHPNLNGMTIRPIAQEVIHNRKRIRFFETCKFSCLSTEPNELLFLYTLVLYILVRYKKVLFEKRGIEIGVISYSEIYRPNNQDDPNLLYGRDVSMRFRCQHTMIESTEDPIQGINLEVFIEAPPAPPSVAAQVANQDWSTADAPPKRKKRKKDK